ncbi:hypothetical protein K2F43_06035 [Clostridium estertheticum]|uniref:hypothetical protein n=1 Tax=Clostridium estertheticum TaxID=238834 RepID=UPI001C6ECAEF|nr:hypothetical protein [Clostridium estertheticum]MBW9170765.1 hypothetical protein [Clostridium estertheticum]WLC74396.1 hypothetical protein KTC99_16720 [Clostridium estertheticum]
MRISLLFDELNDDVILKENIKRCKLEFGYTHNPKTYGDIREIAKSSYLDIKQEDLNEKEDVFKNKLFNIENSDKDNIMIGGLTVIGVIMAILGKIFPDGTSKAIAIYILFLIIGAFTLFIKITYGKNKKILNYTFYNLCNEEFQSVKKQNSIS